MRSVGRRFLIQRNPGNFHPASVVRASPAGLPAQGELTGRLPANTIACWKRNGSAAGTVGCNQKPRAAARPDPAVAPLMGRSNSTSPERNRNTATTAGTPQDKSGAQLGLPEVVSLLSNPLVIGAVELRAKVTVSGTGNSPSPTHEGVFLVYDATGKAELVQKLMGANAGGKPWTKYDFGGTQVEYQTTETKTGTRRKRTARSPEPITLFPTRRRLSRT